MFMLPGNLVSLNLINVTFYNMLHIEKPLLHLQNTKELLIFYFHKLFKYIPLYEFNIFILKINV